ncbi:hypothetical protein [Streptomyces chartreusis]|uniref:hypothetical protein n=1 Tax=Streptomyces chartreusis TaxID=1969 RepID=UPI0016793A92|nr:hypothetical protein [Streptomyces chartreusis]GGX58449.1 hypothetical protein GCM10010321_89140 [Streptomyces chartreusis]
MAPKPAKSLKPTAIEAISGVIASLWAAFIGFELADHDVSVLGIFSVVLALLATGLMIGSRVQDASRSELIKCHEPGCNTQIRVWHTSNAEVTRLRELAQDHCKHGAGT